MTTSNPNVTPPAGGAEPDDEKAADGSGLMGTLEGAVPSADDPDTDVSGDQDVDSVEDDKDNSGA